MEVGVPLLVLRLCLFPLWRGIRLIMGLVCRVGRGIAVVVVVVFGVLSLLRCWLGGGLLVTWCEHWSGQSINQSINQCWSVGSLNNGGLFGLWRVMIVEPSWIECSFTSLVMDMAAMMMMMTILRYGDGDGVSFPFLCSALLCSALLCFALLCFCLAAFARRFFCIRL